MAGITGQIVILDMNCALYQMMTLAHLQVSLFDKHCINEISSTIPCQTPGWNHSRNLGEELHSSPLRVHAIPDTFCLKKFDFFCIGDPT